MFFCRICRIFHRGFKISAGFLQGLCFLEFGFRLQGGMPFFSGMKFLKSTSFGSERITSLLTIRLLGQNPQSAAVGLLTLRLLGLALPFFRNFFEKRARLKRFQRADFRKMIQIEDIEKFQARKPCKTCPF